MRSIFVLPSSVLACCLRKSFKVIYPSVCVDRVKRSVERLKSKSYDIDGISAFLLKSDSEELVYHLQLLFQTCLCSSLVPGSFLVGTITSILKRGKDPTSCASYRPITVASTLCKVFEYVLLLDLLSNVDYMSNQFGFKPYIGCQHAHRAIVLFETPKNGFEVHFCALDVTKAFDSICHSQLWYSLIQLGANVSVILTLRLWYVWFGHMFDSSQVTPTLVISPSVLVLGKEESNPLICLMLVFILFCHVLIHHVF